MRRIYALFSLITSASAFVVPFQHRKTATFLSSITTENIETQISSNAVAAQPRHVTVTTDDVVSSFSTPAEYENSVFQCDETVNFWIDFNRDGSMTAEDYTRGALDVSNRFRNKGGEAMSYWIRHNVRTGYFFTNAALGLAASQLYERLRSKDKLENNFASNFAQPLVFSRMLAEVAYSYEQDYERINDGSYKLPWDMYARSRQISPFFIGQQTSRFVSEAVGTLTRRNRGSEEDKRIWLTDVKSDMYPDYYKTAFHYQSDGWMSQKSADVYETSTETLFLGRQDAMQRSALGPLVQFSKDSKLDRPMKILEVACGTGRFLTFARDNLPLDTEAVALDLSPFYIDKARDNDKNWRSVRKRFEKDNGQEVDIEAATMVQAKAEDMPFEDEEFDAVVCMYLYHEIPREIRAEVAREMERVTKKGGRVILTDSNQKGDRPSMDSTIGNFERMNEPHWRDYIEDFLPTHFENIGMECLTKTVCSSTKTLAFGKPK